MTDPRLDTITGEWRHSREEDSGKARTYRRTSWSLPLSRLPRHQLSLRTDRRFISRSGGRGDAFETKSGVWQIEPGDPLRMCVLWQDNSPETLIELVDVKADRLVLEVISGSIE